VSDTLREALVTAIADIVRDRIGTEIEPSLLRLNHERDEMGVAQQLAIEAKVDLSAHFFGRNAGASFEPAAVPDVFAIAKETAERLADYLLRNELADRATTAARKIGVDIDKITTSSRQHRHRIEAAIRGDGVGEK
jgi:hypothetical protein